MRLQNIVWGGGASAIPDASPGIIGDAYTEARRSLAMVQFGRNFITKGFRSADIAPTAQMTRYKLQQA